MKRNEAHRILNLYFSRKKTFNPSYSMRALARDLKLSPSFVSDILSGKKKIPYERLSDFVMHLDMDEIACIQLKRTLDKNGLSSDEISKEEKDFLGQYYPLEKRKYSLLDKWYNVAILEMSTLDDYDDDPQVMAKKLGISKIEVVIAIENLKALGLLHEVDGKLRKVEAKMRVPTKESIEVVRSFHRQMILRAYNELGQRDDKESFEKRLINGFTLATSSEKVEQVKKRLNDFMYELATELAANSCDKVYQLNVQLFPLDNNERLS